MEEIKATYIEKSEILKTIDGKQAKKEVTSIL